MFALKNLFAAIATLTSSVTRLSETVDTFNAGRCRRRHETRPNASRTMQVADRTNKMALFRQHMIPGKCNITTAMLFAVGCVCMSLVACVSEIMRRISPADLAIHDTYFLVADMHYVVYTRGVMAFFATTYYLLSKVFGRSLNETLGKIHFVLTFIAANCAFFPVVIIETALQPRRYAYPTDSGFEWLDPLNGLYQFQSISVLTLGAVQLIFLANCVYSLFWGRNARHSPERVP
jgi:cytochrome c oxidase subunit 1